MDYKIGILVLGKEVDMIMFDVCVVNFVGFNNVLGVVVMLMDVINIVNVFVVGEVKKWNGKFVGVDMFLLVS